MAWRILCATCFNVSNLIPGTHHSRHACAGGCRACCCWRRWRGVVGRPASGRAGGRGACGWIAARSYAISPTELFGTWPGASCARPVFSVSSLIPGTDHSRHACAGGCRACCCWRRLRGIVGRPASGRAGGRGACGWIVARSHAISPTEMFGKWPDASCARPVSSVSNLIPGTRHSRHACAGGCCWRRWSIRS